MPPLDPFIRDIRSFNRFYVDAIGLLQTGSYLSSYSLTETRILFEIQQARAIQASQIRDVIAIDKSYLSRILKKLEKDSLIRRLPSQHDARALLIELTPKGQSEFANIDQAATDQVNVWIKNLDDAARQELVDHMKAIMTLVKRQEIPREVNG